MSKKNPPLPEPDAFFLSHWLYEWLTPFLWKGYKKPLQAEDLYELTDELQAETLAKKFLKLWTLEQERNPAVPVSTFLILRRMFGRLYYVIGIFHLLQAGANIASPIFIQLLTDYAVLTYAGTPPPAYYGYLYSLAFLLLQIGASFCLTRYFYYSMRTGMKIRVCLTSVIYRKMMKLDGLARQEFSGGRILNMVSSDLMRIEQVTAQGHYIWSGPLQIVVILVLLIQEISYPALTGVGILVLMIPVQSFIFTRLGQLRRAVAGTTDARVKLTQEFLQGMKIIKLFAWEESFLERLMALRRLEVRKIQFVNIWSAILMGLSTSLPILASVVSFIVYALAFSNGVLFAPKIFSALAYFNLLRFPLIILPNTIRMFIEAGVAFKRLDDYLNAKELHKLEKSTDESKYALEMENATFQWEVLPEKLEKKERSETDKSASKVSLINDTEEEGDVPMKEVERPTLRNLNVKIKKGSLVAIVGAVGSGKSSLLNALLGEMKQVSGKLSIRGSLGYSLQQPWIRNGSVKENVTFGKQYDEEKYNQIMKWTTLEKDLEWLPAGSETFLGEKGVQISGGQKARVSLARVMYWGPDIVLLDDPLSAVDVHVGKAIFHNCIRKALRGKTVLLVTHQLDHLKNVDYVLYMKDGEVVEQGTYTELLNLDGEFSRQIKTFVGSDATESNEDLQNAEKLLKKRDQKPSQLVTMEERMIGSVSGEVYRSYLQAAGGVWSLVAILLTVILSQVTKISNDLWLVGWSDGYLQSNWNLSTPTIAGVYFTFGVSQGITTALFGAMLSFGFARASNIYHRDAIFGVFRSPMSFFDTTPLGRIMNRFSKDTDTMDSALPSAMQMFVSLFAGLIGTLGLMCYAAYWLLVALFPISFVYYFIQTIYLRTSRELKRIESISRSPVYSHFSESMTGLSTIRAYDSETMFIQNNDDNLNGNSRATYLQIMIQRWLGIRLETLGGLLSFFTALIGVIFAGTIPAALIGVSLTYSTQVTSSLNFAVRQAVEVEVNANSIERIHHYARNLEPEAPFVIEDNRPPSNWPHDGAINLKDLEIKYNPASDAVIKRISLSITAREKIGIVGRTGAGKSTITYALFRLIEPTFGSIIIDDVDILKIGLHDLRRRLATIPQDPVLFSGTIRSNLDPFTEYTDENIWSVLEEVNMKKSIAEKTEKLEFKVETNGENFSSGQRQLLCLARAMLRKPRVLIMDEATANVDMESDELIQKSLRRGFSESTILTVAHRLNTVIDYDKILVLNQGNIEEFDTPYNLLNQDGLFNNMVSKLGAGTAKVLRNIATAKHEGKEVDVAEIVMVEDAVMDI